MFVIRSILDLITHKFFLAVELVFFKKFQPNTILIYTFERERERIFFFSFSISEFSDKLATFYVSLCVCRCLLGFNFSFFLQKMIDFQNP